MTFSSILKYSFLAVGFLSLAISSLFSNIEIGFIKPLFYVLFYGVYWQATRKINVLLIIFLCCGIIAEFFTALGYQENFEIITTFYIFYYLVGTLLLYPVLKRMHFENLKSSDLTIAFLILIFLTYILISVILMSLDLIVNFSLLILNAICFLYFIASCFYVAGFNKHSKNLYMFLVGICYLFVGICSYLNELIFQLPILSVLVNLSEIVAQIIFVYFLIHIKDIIKPKEWLV